MSRESKLKLVEHIPEVPKMPRDAPNQSPRGFGIPFDGPTGAPGDLQEPYRRTKNQRVFHGPFDPYETIFCGPFDRRQRGPSRRPQKRDDRGTEMGTGAMGFLELSGDLRVFLRPSWGPLEALLELDVGPSWPDTWLL